MSALSHSFLCSRRGAPPRAARARCTISLGRSRHSRCSGSTPSPSFIVVEPVPATSSLAIRAPPRRRASEEPRPCSPRHPPLLARWSRRSAMATSRSSVSHSSERTSPPWLSSRTAATHRTEPELLIRAGQGPELVVSKPSELLPGRSPPQRRPSPRRSTDGLPCEVQHRHVDCRRHCFQVLYLSIVQI
jgi:hypothetical protein